MTVEVATDKLVDQLGSERTLREVSRDAMDVWFTESQNILAEYDSREDDTNYFPIMQSGQPPWWDAQRQAWMFRYSHLAAVFAEYGTKPHEIRAKEAEYLAFEWPDAPEEIRERFSETFPLVFFKKVNHPGTDAVRYVRDARDDAVQFLRSGGA